MHKERFISRHYIYTDNKIIRYSVNHKHPQLSVYLFHSLTHSHTLTHSLTHTYSLIHSFIHSLTHSLTPTHSFIHSLTHSPFLLCMLTSLRVREKEEGKLSQMWFRVLRSTEVTDVTYSSESQIYSHFEDSPLPGRGTRGKSVYRKSSHGTISPGNTVQQELPTTSHTVTFTH